MSVSCFGGSVYFSGDYTLVPEALLATESSVRHNNDHHPSSAEHLDLLDSGSVCVFSPDYYVIKLIKSSYIVTLTYYVCVYMI